VAPYQQIDGSQGHSYSIEIYNPLSASSSPAIWVSGDDIGR